MIEIWKPYLLIIAIGLFFYLPGLFTIPPTDRDESQYTQVTKQMLEDRDFLRIKFQDGLFNSKPIGMYWAQAISVSLFSSSDYNEIWPYRVPSIFALILGSIVFYYLLKDIFGEKVSLLSAIIFETSFHAILEAHIAKADALLLLATIIVQALALRVYINNQKRVFLIWFFLGIGILFKGPVLPGVFLLTLISLSYLENNYKLILKFKPIFGFLIVFSVIFPWILAYYHYTGLFFVKESLLKDVLPRFMTIVERHSGYPGYYLLFSLLSFWPWSIFIVPGAYTLWTNKNDQKFKFLLCWFVPAWLFLELVPTKLPNYIFPLYPVLSVGVADYLIKSQFKHWTAKANLYLWCIFSVFFAYFLFRFEPYIDKNLSLSSIALLVIILTSICGCLVFRNNKKLLAISAFFSLLALPIFYGQIMPSLENLHLTRKFQKMLSSKYKPANMVFTGYREPSLVFALGKEIKIRKDAIEAALFFLENCNNLAVVNDKDQRTFLEVVKNRAKLGLEVRGFDYTHFRWTTVYLYERNDC